MLVRAVVVALMLGLTDGHWAILQSIAWAKMLFNYSRSAPLGTAIEQTFDGEHPCAMCKMIQSAKQSANRQELQEPSVKSESLFCETYTSLRFDTSWVQLPLDSLFTYPARTDPPPVPPPRRLT
jgi:hypothetical protein